MPAGFEGNIFERPNKDYIVTLVTRDRSIFDNLSPRKNVRVVVRVPDADKYSEAEVWSPDWKGGKPAVIEQTDRDVAANALDPEKWKEEEAIQAAKSARAVHEGQSLVVTIPEIKSAGILVLKRTQ